MFIELTNENKQRISINTYDMISVEQIKYMNDERKLTRIALVDGSFYNVEESIEFINKIILKGIKRRYNIEMNKTTIKKILDNKFY